MGLLDDAIREHLELKRRRGADPAEIARAEQEALGPVRRDRSAADAEDEAPHPADAEAGAPAAPAAATAAPEPHADGERAPFMEDAPGAFEDVPARTAPREADAGDPPIEPGVAAGSAPQPPAAPAAPPQPPIGDEQTRVLLPEEREPAAPGVSAGSTPQPPAADEPDPAPAADAPRPRDAHDAGHVAPAHHRAPLQDEPGSVDPRRHSDIVNQPTTEFRVEDIEDEPFPPSREASAAPPPAPPARPVDRDRDRAADEDPGDPEEDVLEATPDFLEETPEHDRLWFEQRPPRDFDFDG